MKIGEFINLAEMERDIYKFSGNRGEYVTCIVGLRGMDASGFLKFYIAGLQIGFQSIIIAYS